MSRRDYPVLFRVCYFLGVFLILIGALCAVPIPAAIWLDHDVALVWAFALSSVAAIVSGLIMITCVGRQVDLRLGGAMIVAALGWLMAAFVGALPFAISGHLHYIDALFESMSGFTATGLTMFRDVEALPQALLIWRSLTQWIGGVGVVVLFLSVLVTRTGVVNKLYAAEARGERLVPSIGQTARRMWAIYALYTGGCFLLLWALGMPWFDSINTSMTALATGGFTVNNSSLGGYTWQLQVAVIPFMLLGAISFAAHQQLLGGHIKKFFNIEVRTLLLLAGVTTALLLLWRGLSVSSLRLSSFQVISALSGTGFSTVRVAQWDDVSKVVLTLLMVCGGCYGSTSSAIKIIRIVTLLSAAAWVVRRALLPESAVAPFKLGGHVHDVNEVMDISLYAFLYVLVLLLGTLVFMLGGQPLVDSLFETGSALGNVGLSVGITGVTMPVHEKIVLILSMWVGRLEIIPVLVFLRKVLPPWR